MAKRSAAKVDESPRKQPEEPSLDSSLLLSTFAALRFAMPGFRLNPFRFVFFCQNLSSVNETLTVNLGCWEFEGFFVQKSNDFLSSEDNRFWLIQHPVEEPIRTILTFTPVADAEHKLILWAPLFGSDHTSSAVVALTISIFNPTGMASRTCHF